LVYTERYSASTYTGVTNFYKQSGFLAHPVFTYLNKKLAHGDLQKLVWNMEVIWTIICRKVLTMTMQQILINAEKCREMKEKEE